MTLTSLCQALASVRHDVSAEVLTQNSVYSLLAAKGLQFEREVRLDAKSRIDFLVGRIGIEVKVGPVWSPMKIYQQLERYSLSDKIDALILLTNKAMRLPPEINGKPAALVSLGKAWL